MPATTKTADYVVVADAVTVRISEKDVQRVMNGETVSLDPDVANPLLTQGVIKAKDDYKDGDRVSARGLQQASQAAETDEPPAPDVDTGQTTDQTP